MNCKRCYLLVGCIIVTCLRIVKAEDDAEDADTALNKETCYERREGCCSELDLGDITTLQKCAMQLAHLMPADGAKDMAKAVKFISCLVECMYKLKKFIGRDDTLNMRMVKKDADKLYHTNPKERDYYVTMYQFCGNEAAAQYKSVKSNPAGAVALKDACRPYYMFVFLCTAQYHHKHECPYFKWEGKSKTPAAKECMDAQMTCFDIENMEKPEHDE